MLDERRVRGVYEVRNVPDRRAGEFNQIMGDILKAIDQKDPGAFISATPQRPHTFIHVALDPPVGNQVSFEEAQRLVTGIKPTSFREFAISPLPKNRRVVIDFRMP